MGTVRWAIAGRKIGTQAELVPGFAKAAKVGQLPSDAHIKHKVPSTAQIIALR